MKGDQTIKLHQRVDGNYNVTVKIEGGTMLLFNLILEEFKIGFIGQSEIAREIVLKMHYDETELTKLIEESK
jgi:hypothetical protein